MSKFAKATLLIVAILVLLGVAGYVLQQRQNKVDPGRPGAMGNMPCVRVNRERFGPWNPDAIPSGDLNRMAQQFLKGDSQRNGSIVGGFFKAIDVYPNENRAKFYEQEIKTYAATVALPHWDVLIGELACDNNAIA
ncbi:hypothetical protein [Phaeodactylibacter xiamenensis]|jgi:hypothetical protein|uniref:hypothetical protein n=1 Tax=Phaeodactylibacter xiamenensis TaxID=1524460 RepID=UPI003BA8BE8C